MDRMHIYLLTEFALNHKNKDCFAVFNSWKTIHNIEIKSYDEVVWALNFIKKIRKLDEDMIEDAIKIEKKNLKLLRKEKWGNMDNCPTDISI